MQTINTATLTFHRTTNYGAIFQTYALQKALESIGVISEVLDYRNPTIENRYKKPGIKYYLNLKNLLKILLNNSFIRDNRANFNDFTDKFIRISKKKYVQSDISLSDEVYKYFIVGSDQVWNPDCMGRDSNYLLHFVNSGIRNAYAASFGFSSLDDTLKSWYRDDLSKFSYISLRESSGNGVLHSVLRQDAPVVLDPTLLLSNEWIELAKSIPRIMSENYIVVYVMKETHSLFNKAKEYAKANNLKIVYINDRLFPHAGMKNKFYTHPIEWLNLLFYSQCIFTNSFHGTAFSVNFNKTFWTELLPEPSKTNSRIIDFLSLIGLQNRILNEHTNFNQNKIEYLTVNNTIKELRTSSMLFLKQIFE